MAQPCFDNAIAQVIHKYANILLLVLISMLAWWGSGIDARLAVVAQEQAKRTSRIEEIKQVKDDLVMLRVQFSGIEVINVTLKSHEAMLKRIEARLDKLINGRQYFKESE